MIFDITDEIEKRNEIARNAENALHDGFHEKIFAGIRKELERISIEQNLSHSVFQEVYQKLKYKEDTSDQLGPFIQYFENLHPDFFDKLRKLCPGLTLHEMRHCACIRMNYDTKEIARLFHVNPASIQKARVRLKKKFKLKEPFILTDLIATL